MPSLVTNGGLLFPLSMWGMQMQVSETVRMASNETCAEHNFDADKQNLDANDSLNSTFRISQIILKPGFDYCNYQRGASFRCEEKKQEGKGVWTRGRRLGGGTFGEVFAATAEPLQGALKMAAYNRNAEYRQENCKSIMDEKENLRNIVAKLNEMRQYQEGSMCKDYLMHFVDTKPCVVQGTQVVPVKNAFVMNKMSGDLDAYTSWAGERLSLKDQVTCMSVVIRKVIEGLRCMHMAEWAHLDIKAGNILVKWDEEAAACPTEVRLTDFGEAAVIGKPKGGKAPSYAGSAWYIPLEMFSPGGFIASGRLDWCSFAFMFRSYPDVKARWDEYWEGDCGNFGPNGRPIHVWLTQPRLEPPRPAVSGAIRPSRTISSGKLGNGVVKPTISGAVVQKPTVGFVRPARTGGTGTPNFGAVPKLG